MNYNTANDNMNTFKNIFTLFLTVLFGAGVAFGQITDRTDRQIPASSQQQSQSIISQLPTGKIIQDGPVDPAEYIVGPGDIFTVSVWTAQPLMFQVPVTPEGTVIIPTVAEVNVSGKTLENAKKLVLAEIRKKYISGTSSFTLLTPRSFTVTVLGAVLNEGTVIVQSTQRVDAAILLANDVQKYRELTGANTSDPKQSREILKKISGGSKRNITINRRNGTVVRADVEKYHASLNTAFNPLLLDGDIITVQPINIEMEYVGIYGAVSKEGNYEFVEGDSISGLLRMGGGLTALSDGGRGLLYRTTASGEQEQTEVNLTKIIADPTSDVPLQRGDRLVVRKKSVVERGGVVKVEGEVVMPGVYPIMRDSTTLSQVIAMAGGMTQFASLNSSMVLRVKQSDQNKIDSVQLKRGLASLENVEYLVHEILISGHFSPVQTDFTELFEKGKKEFDITLKDGDRIVIAPKTNAVYVFGEVKNPGFLTFRSGQSAEYYIELSGGVTEHAEEGDVRVIKASTRQWLTPEETTIEEGDFLWVPMEPYRAFGYYLGIYSQVFGIVGTVFTLFILVSQQ